MNEQILQRLPKERPTDPHEVIFWYIDRINLNRSLHWNQDFLEPYIRELSDLIEDQYTNWLRAEKITGNERDLVSYQYLVLPYISFRFFNAPYTKEVNLFTVSSAQKKRFLDCMVSSFQEDIPDPNFLRALIAQSLKMLLSFCEVLQRRREQ